jgi:ribosomal protein S18 acetylase RimI-like enzyme
MAAAEHWARARGLRHLTLQTGAANEEARAFYRSLGYLEEEIRLTHSLSEDIESVVVNRSVAR